MPLLLLRCCISKLRPDPLKNSADYFQGLLYSVSDTTFSDAFPWYRLWRSAVSQISYIDKALRSLETAPDSFLDDPTDNEVSLATSFLNAEQSRLAEVKNLLDTIPLSDKSSFSGPVSVVQKDLLPGVRKRFASMFKVLPRASSWIYGILADMSYQQAMVNFQFRTSVECLEANRDGWYVVFDTLTYDPSRFDDEKFRKQVFLWIKKLRMRVGAACYGSYSAVTGHYTSDFFRYCLVFEQHKSGRLHAHCIYFMRDLPVGTSYADPNEKNRSRPNRLQPVGFPRPDFGFSNPIAVRFDGRDVWARLGWSWPLDKTGVPRAPSSPVALARYLTKYISKERGVARCRMSQNFGILSLVKRLKTLQIQELTQLQTSRQKFNYHTMAVPKSLMRQMVRRALALQIRRNSLPSCMNGSTEMIGLDTWPEKLRSAMSLITPLALSSRVQRQPLRPDKLLQGLTHVTQILKHSNLEILYLQSMKNSVIFNKYVQEVLDKHEIKNYTSFSSSLNVSSQRS